MTQQQEKNRNNVTHHQSIETQPEMTKMMKLTEENFKVSKILPKKAQELKKGIA